MTYKGFLGYMPMVDHLAQNGLVVAGKVARHAGQIYLNPKSVDGTPPVGFVGRMGALRPLSGPVGVRQR